MSSSGVQPRTIVAIRGTAFHLVGCSAYMAIIFKSLSCCMKRTPQYLALVGLIIIWLFIFTLHQTYKGFEEVIEEWKSDGAFGQRLNQGTQGTRKSKRKNHRGGFKAK